MNKCVSLSVTGWLCLPDCSCLRCSNIHSIQALREALALFLLSLSANVLQLLSRSRSSFQPFNTHLHTDARTHARTHSTYDFYSWLRAFDYIYLRYLFIFFLYKIRIFFFFCLLVVFSPRRCNRRTNLSQSNQIFCFIIAVELGLLFRHQSNAKRKLKIAIYRNSEGDTFIFGVFFPFTFAACSFLVLIVRVFNDMR